MPNASSKASLVRSALKVWLLPAVLILAAQGAVLHVLSIPEKNITIPQSVAELKPRETVVVMVTTDDVLVNGRSVGKIKDLAANDDKLIIEPLRAALKEQSDSSLRSAAQEDLADREVTIMGDKGTPFTVLKKVMATATAADYGKVSLAVIQREIEAKGGA